MNVNLSEINDIKKYINVRYIKDMQNTVRKLFGVSFYILDANDRFIIGDKHYNPLCSLVQSSEKGRECCELSDKAILDDVKLSGKTICRKCMAVGLTDFAIPIMIYGQHVATLFSGQVNTLGLTSNKVKKFARDIGMDEERMIKAYRKVQFIDSAYFEPILDLLKLVARELAETIKLNIERETYKEQNHKSTQTISKEYNFQIFMNDIHSRLFMSEWRGYDEDAINDVIVEIKETLGFAEMSIYKDISGKGIDFRPSAGDIENAEPINGEKLRAVYCIEKYGFVCNDRNSELSRYITNGDYITVSLPYYLDKRFAGFINMSSAEKRIFTVSEINFFKNVSNTIGDFYYRVIADKALKENKIIKENIAEVMK